MAAGSLPDVVLRHVVGKLQAKGQGSEGGRAGHGSGDQEGQGSGLGVFDQAGFHVRPLAVCDQLSFGIGNGQAMGNGGQAGRANAL